MALAPVILHQDMVRHIKQRITVLSQYRQNWKHPPFRETLRTTLCLSHFFATANYYDQAFLKVLPKAKTRQRQRYFLSILDCIVQTADSE